MQLVVNQVGEAKCVYAESLPVHSLGSVSISRASHVEPDLDGYWTADLTPMNGPILGPFSDRSLALQAETIWLHDNWLIKPD